MRTRRDNQAGGSEMTNERKSSGLKKSVQKIKAQALKTYYGNPMKDMKLIAITGSTGKTIVAHYVHEILKAAGEQVAVLASDTPFKVTMLHKFLSDAWKAGANYIIVTVPNESLRENVFYGLPVHIAAMTDFVTAGLNDMSAKEFLDDEKTLFDMKPQIVVLNENDLNYETFSDFKGTQDTLGYGSSNTNVKIINSKLYSRGTEATLSLKNELISVATFVPGETAVSYMACAAAIAEALNISSEHIIEGIAEYNPE